MSFYASSAKIVGSASSSGLLQAYEHKEGPEQLFVVFSGISSSETPPSSNQVWQDFFVRFQQKEGRPLQNLQDSVSELRGLYSQKGVELEIGTCLIKDKVLYCVLSGGVGLYLLRNDQLIQLSKSEVGSQRSLSGWLKSEDLYFLATSKATPLLGDREVVDTFVQDGFNELSEFLSSQVAQSNVQMQGLIAIKISADDRPVSISNGEVRGSSKVLIRQKLLVFLDAVLARLPDPRMKIKPETSDLESRSRRKKMPLIAALLAFLLLVSIGFGIKKRSQQEMRQAYEPQLAQAQHELSEAYSLRGIDRSRAKELVLSARNIVEELKTEGIEDQRLMELESQISQSLGEIAGIYETKAELFLDLTLISSSYRPDTISYSDQFLIALDREEKRLVSVGLETKKTETVSDGEFLPDARAAVLWEGQSFVLSSDGIRRVGDEVELLVKAENWNASDVLIQAFAGNLYVLDKKEGAIWRYSNLGLDSTLESRWLGEGIEYDFSKVLSWAIDGSIWVLRESDILQLNRGVPVAFALDFTEMPNLSQVFTDEETENLYFLDKSEGRILVFNKQGDYVAQYLSEALKTAGDFVVSEKFKKIIFLKDSKLYEIKLN